MKQNQLLWRGAEFLGRAFSDVLESSSGRFHVAGSRSRQKCLIDALRAARVVF
jgi:hypothetical protein